MLKRSLIQGTMVVGLLVSAIHAEEKASLKQRFLSEGPKGWSRIALMEKNISGKLLHKAWAFEDGKRNDWGFERAINIFRKEDLIVLETNQKKSGDFEIMVLGKEYGFRLEQKKESRDFQLRALVSNEAMAKAFEKSIFFRAIQSKREIWNTALKELVEDPGFVLHDIVAFRESGLELIKIQFSCPPKKNRPDFKMASATFIPEYDWALKSAEHNISNGTIYLNLEYVMNKESIPTVKTYGRKLHFPKEKVDEFYETSFDDMSYGVVPESGFTLTNYGLPEPKAAMPVQVQSRTHIWLIGGAILLFTSAIIFRFMAIRNNRSQMKEHV